VDLALGDLFQGQDRTGVLVSVGNQYKGLEMRLRTEENEQRLEMGKTSLKYSRLVETIPDSVTDETVSEYLIKVCLAMHARLGKGGITNQNNFLANIVADIEAGKKPNRDLRILEWGPETLERMAEEKEETEKIFEEERHAAKERERKLKEFDAQKRSCVYTPTKLRH